MKPGTEVGRIEHYADMPQTLTVMTTQVNELTKMNGKHAIFVVFESETKEKSMCSLENFAFNL